MSREIEIRVAPKDVENSRLHREQAAKFLGVSAAGIAHLSLIRRSLDARGRKPVYVLKFLAYLEGAPKQPDPFRLHLQDVSRAETAVIIGFGPAGIFAALRLIELGIKPVVLERGKAVRERRKDIAAITKRGDVNPECNYCFGEGGAGTFSDGKLYTRSNKRGSVDRILGILAAHGASPEILVDAHPHIGTNKLPQVVQALRHTILECGGEVHFDCAARGLLRRSGSIAGVSSSGGDEHHARAVLLATGHSARDVFALLHREKIEIAVKPFALGVRVEHPQCVIDRLQYHDDVRDPFLPAASYALRTQVSGHGVFSFCMCPGGIICPAATAPDEVVVNGWSPSKRNSRYANSGIVVEVHTEDLRAHEAHGVLAGIALQQSIEQAAFRAGGGKQVAPALRLTDFIEGKLSRDLPDCSYLPGITPADFKAILPQGFLQRLREAFTVFGSRQKGYITSEAVVVGVESRTSSPVRIPRDPASGMHPQIQGLFSCGEGAGFAGGIVSAAMDGEVTADSIGRFYGVSK